LNKIETEHYQPLFNKIDELMKKKERVLVAIDGNCTAGKTTLAAQLKEIYSCNVFAMDDFFLQPYQRTAERYDEPGGNVDYERFKQEILEPLRSGQSFSYRRFDCQTMQFRAERAQVTPNQLNIIEGVYSLHPYFGEPYDLKVILGLDEARQRSRLKKRNPDKYERFINEWMPLEDKYFAAFKVAEKCDVEFVTDF